MSIFSSIFGLLFLSGCADWSLPFVSASKKLTSSQCQHTLGFTLLSEGVKYQECDKQALIQDFREYEDYITALQEAGELWTEIVPQGIPNKLRDTKRVFCHRGCYATAYLHELCFHWEENKRRSFQQIEYMASQEPEGCKEKYKNILKGQPIPKDLNWRKDWRYKLFKEGKLKDLGEKIWKPL